MRPRVAVVGSINWDMSMRVPSLPAPGETVTGGEFLSCLGGKGANQAVAAARAGGEVFFLSCIGTDRVADEVCRTLKATGLPLSGLLSIEAAETGKAMIFVDGQGENTIGVASGANALFGPEYLKPHADSLTGADVLLLQMEIPLDTVTTAARMVRESKTRVVLNPAPATRVTPEVIATASILTPNRVELEQITQVPITNQSELEQAGHGLLNLGLEAMVVTLGAEGSFAMTDGQALLLPAFRVTSTDTTGAGDVFNGALAVALGADATLPEAARFAMAAAALSVTVAGAIPSIPLRTQIDTFLAQHGIV